MCEALRCSVKLFNGHTTIHSTRSVNAEWIVKRRREWMILGQDVDNEELKVESDYLGLAEPTDG